MTKTATWSSETMRSRTRERRGPHQGCNPDAEACGWGNALTDNQEKQKRKKARATPWKLRLGVGRLPRALL